MIIKIMGLIDIMLALMFFTLTALPRMFIFTAAVYLIVKGLIFSLGEDIASYFDIAIGVYLLIAGFGFTLNIVSIVSAVFLAQKGLISLF